MEKDNIYKSLS